MRRLGILRRVQAMFGSLSGGILGSILIVIGLASYVLFTALVWWISDLAYAVHWLLGAPVRILAFLMVLGVLAGIVSTIIALSLMVFATAINIWSDIRGKERKF